MAKTYNLNCDKNKWYGVQKNINVGYYLNAENTFTLRVEAYLWAFDANFLEFTKAIADTFRANLEPEKEFTLPPEMVSRPFGHDFGFADYQN